MTHTTNKILAIASAAAAVLFTVGCQTDKTDSDAAWQDPFFPSDSSTPASETMNRRQFAIAAVQDGMLFPLHFDGNELNGLGQAKVDLMLEGRSLQTPLQVYLNQPANDGTNNDRIEAIARSLRGAGLADGDFKVNVGPNPGTLMPADAGIRALATTGTQTASDPGRVSSMGESVAR